jgi:hypothetical protein
MRCEHRCFEIGGPWIDASPSCPEHGRDGNEDYCRRGDKRCPNKHACALDCVHGIEKTVVQTLPDVPGNTWEFRTLWSLLSEHIDLNVNLGLDGSESWDEKSRILFAKLDTLFDRIIP